MNGERLVERAEELTEYLQNFPNSKLAPILQKELDYLQSITK